MCNKDDTWENLNNFILLKETFVKFQAGLLTFRLLNSPKLFLFRNRRQSAKIGLLKVQLNATKTDKTKWNKKSQKAITHKNKGRRSRKCKNLKECTSVQKERKSTLSQLSHCGAKITDIRNILQRVGVSDECVDVAVASLYTQVEKLKSGHKEFISLIEKREERCIEFGAKTLNFLEADGKTFSKK